MASISTTSFPQSFNFVDNPVVVTVTNNTSVEGSSMHQTVIQVVDSATGAVLYSFELEMVPGRTASVDISSALRAIITPSLNPIIWNDGAILTYPSVEFYIQAFDRYMLDGAVCDGDSAYWPGNSDKGVGFGAHAYLGGLSELERFVLSNHPQDFYEYLTFSRKPLNGHRWGGGDMLLSSAYTDSGIQTTVHRVTSDEVSLPSNHRHFLFLNSMGVYETVSAVMRESLSYGMESAVHSLVESPSYRGVASVSTHKTKPRASLQMSSGYTTREWADWWAMEFLAAKHYWVKMDVNRTFTKTVDEEGAVTAVSFEPASFWMPCTVTPAEENTLIYNRAEQRLPHVNFDVQLAVTGSASARPNLTV